MRCSLKPLLFVSVIARILCSAEDDEVSDAHRKQAQLVSEQQDEASLKSGSADEEASAISLDTMTSSELAAIHKKIDANNDGNVTMAEIVSYAQLMRRVVATKELNTVIDSHDLNSDRKLDLNEFVGQLHKFATEKEGYDKMKDDKVAQFDELDKNKDGLVDADELPAMFHHNTNEKVETMLASMALRQKDSDGDGVLTPNEFWSHMYNEDHFKDGQITANEQDEFNKLDIDGSGSLNVDEVRAWESGDYHTELAMKELFHVVDKDKDSKLSAKELLDARERIKGYDQAHMHIVNWHMHRESDREL